MPYKVLPATEDDIPALMAVQFSAFHDDPFHDAMCPGGDTVTARDAAAQRTLQEWRETPYQELVKCVDESTGQIVGMSVWDFHDHERTEGQWKVPCVIDWCDGLTKKRAEVFWGRTIAKRQRLWEGRRHYLCQLLAVHRDHQRRGVGQAIIEWGIARSEAAGLPAYLEASKYGHGLYHKLGYRDIPGEANVFKASDWEGDRDVVCIPMIRMPRQGGGVHGGMSLAKTPTPMIA